MAPPLAVGESRAFAMKVGELEREYLLHLPPGYDARRPSALVLAFHGYTGSAAREEAGTGLSRHADAHGFVVVYPQGTGFAADGQLVTSWNDLAGSRSKGPEGPICSESAVEYPHPPECGEPTRCTWASCHDDLGFVARLLDRLEGELCLDLDRVYATGMSNGGMFVHRLGCEMPERFAAIAPVGGTLARGFGCAPRAPLAMLNITGSEDVDVSQRGGVSSDGYYYESAEAVMAAWAGPASQGCDASAGPHATPWDGVLGLRCIERDHCTSGAEVVHCSWAGGHAWPAAAGRPLGNDVIWEFFSRHSRAHYRGAREHRTPAP